MTNNTKQQRKEAIRYLAERKEEYAPGVKAIYFPGVKVTQGGSFVSQSGPEYILEIQPIKGLNLSNRYLPEARFQKGRKYEHVVLKGSYLPKRCFWDAVFENSNFRNANLEGSCFQNGHFNKCDFRGASLENINGYYADMEGSDLRGANLIGAGFHCANLRNIRAENTDFRKVRSLKEIDLEGARLNGADLRGQYFKFANLKNADLRNADLRGVSWMETDLERTLLSGAIVDDGNGKEYVLV